MDQLLERLLDDAAHGDTEAFADYYDQTTQLAMKLAWTVAGHDANRRDQHLPSRDLADIEDVVCAAYLDAWREVVSFRQDGRSPVSWILTRVQAGLRETMGVSQASASNHDTTNNTGTGRLPVISIDNDTDELVDAEIIENDAVAESSRFSGAPVLTRVADPKSSVHGRR